MAKKNITVSLSQEQCVELSKAFRGVFQVIAYDLMEAAEGGNTRIQRDDLIDTCSCSAYLKGLSPEVKAWLDDRQRTLDQLRKALQLGSDFWKPTYIEL